VIMQTLHSSWIQENEPVKLFEALIVVHLLVLSIMLRTVNGELNASTITVGIYDQMRWVVGLLILFTGLGGYLTTKGKLSTISGIFFVLLTLPFMENLPYGGFTLCFIISILLFVGRAFVLYRREQIRQKVEITGYSVKEALDSQHSGILFAESDGSILLVNRQMLFLMEEFTGSQQRNAEKFWGALQEGSSPGLRCDDHFPGDFCLMNTVKEGTWQLVRKKVAWRGKDICQIIATDVTEEEAANRKLQEYHRQLEEKKEQLQIVLDNLEAIKKQEAFSKTYNYIHDVLGQKISILQQIFHRELIPDREMLLPLVETLAEEIAAVREEDPAEMYQQIVSSFAPLGVNLNKTGNLPENEAIARVMVNIIREGVTNAVRHGQAQNIDIVIKEGEGYTLSIVNDGRLSAENIIQGGGLREINRKITELGGLLQIKTRPEFQLIVEIPRPRGAI
ncbi:MAG: hypothetical protein GX581_05325, partial [Syntrophomonadaceae bacterium]|nr:hypothetical protein [Syntrophomonadaceae bacterium]